MIMIEAKIVSRGRAALSASAPSISITMGPTSMIVIDTVNTSVPKGSPSRCATTSAMDRGDDGAAQRRDA